MSDDAPLYAGKDDAPPATLAALHLRLLADGADWRAEFPPDDEFFRQVEEERAPLRDIEQLHASANAENRQATIGNLADEHPIKIFASRIKQPHTAVELISIATWIEVAAADEYEGVEHVEHAAKIVLIFEGGQNNRNSTGCLDRVVVASGDVAERWSLLTRGAIISVQTHERLALHDKSLCESEVSEVPCGVAFSPGSP